MNDAGRVIITVDNTTSVPYNYKRDSVRVAIVHSPRTPSRRHRSTVLRSSRAAAWAVLRGRSVLTQSRMYRSESQPQTTSLWDLYLFSTQPTFLMAARYALKRSHQLVGTDG